MTPLAIGAPTTMDELIPDKVQRIVYVVGNEDSVPRVNRVPNFQHRDGTAVESILVRLENSAVNPETGKAFGVSHTQYFAAPDERDPYVQATHDFLAQLVKNSESGFDPRSLLRLRGIEKSEDLYVLDVANLS